ncbi:MULTISPECIES: hypothetical protein [Paenibacillus]|uniref:Uncharacterized protein n=1 Tax=Paenibacillus campinasensis TaxID=66347 RepID=A0ABW9SYR2_9BACL|nr:MULTISPECIES: hypothetical protein [Paenibacillus]MUG66168.1 hypothetical protein [Paenibacillus campinasensis]PAK49432.1 hypothetical protein CHH75_20945 [Paenibacillus sp. 7541]
MRLHIMISAVLISFLYTFSSLFSPLVQAEAITDTEVTIESLRAGESKPALDMQSVVVSQEREDELRKIYGLEPSNTDDASIDVKPSDVGASYENARYIYWIYMLFTL